MSDLLPCPFCGRPLFRGRAKINPYAVCRTESCFGKKAAAVNLDNPADVAAWNRRTPASAVLPEARSADTPTSPNAREAAIIEAIKRMDQIGRDWKADGQMEKFYATNYLVEAIRPLGDKR